MTRWLIAAVALLAVAGTAYADPGLADLVQAGQDAAALKLIESGANVNAPQGDGTTALDWATYRLDVPLVKALLKRGANPNLINDLGSTPLEEAVEAADLPLVKTLLRAGAQVNQANPDGETALMLAAHTGVLKIVKLLVRHGASVNARERTYGQTALMWAADLDYPDVVKYLVKRGAKVNTREYDNAWLEKSTQITSEPRAQYRPEGGLTPLLYAVRAGCMACVQTLVKVGANVNQPAPHGVTPLISAIGNQQYGIASYLLRHGANPRTWDWWGRTPLYVAVDMHTYNHFYGLSPTPKQLAASMAQDLKDSVCVNLIRTLLNDGVDPNVQLNLHRPTRGGNSGRFRDDLLRTGATPLLRAAMGHDTEVVELLLQHGARVDLPNVNGVTPLMAAAGIGFRGPKGSQVPDHRGDYAPGAQARAINTIAILLKAGANVNARITDTSSHTARIARRSSMSNRQGETALYGPIYWGWTRVVRYLLQHGAKVNVADDLGRTPLTAATQGVGIQGHQFKPVQAIIAMIREAAAAQQVAARTAARTPAPASLAVARRTPLTAVR